MTKVSASTNRAYPELGDNFKGPFAPCEVATYIVGATTPETVPRLGPTKLNKLVYISHGWLLGKHQKPLVSEEAEVWEYGPVSIAASTTRLPACTTAMTGFLSGMNSRKRLVQPAMVKLGASPLAPRPSTSTTSASVMEALRPRR